MFKRTLSRCSYYINKPPTAIQMLEKRKLEYSHILSIHQHIHGNATCYECLQYMKRNDISYLPALGKEFNLIGVLNRYDVKQAKLFHEYEEEEDEKLLDEYRESRIS